MWRQVNLQQGTIHMTTWVENHPQLKVGSQLTLKGEGGYWRVMWMSHTKLEVPPNNDWKVGGLVGRRK